MKNKHIKPVLITSGVFMIIIGTLFYFYIKDPQRNYLYIDTSEKVDIVLAKQKIGAGDIISTENIYVRTVDKDSILSLDTVYINSDDVLGKKALYPMNPNQFIYQNYLISEENWYQGKVRYPIEVSIESTVANSVNVGDYVDLLVEYQDTVSSNDIPLNYDIVVSKIIIEDLKDSNGVSLKGRKDEGIAPTYAIVSLTYKELDMYLDAKKQGDIKMTIYDDLSIDANVPTYIMNNKFEQEGYYGE